MPKRVSLLSLLFYTVTTSTIAAPLGEPRCPETWTDSNRTSTLQWGEVWAGWESLAPIEGQTRDGKDWQEAQRKRDEAFWIMKDFKKPAFLRCRYGAGLAPSERFEVIVPVPEDSAKCHTAWRSTPEATHVVSISCTPGKAPVPPPSVAEAINAETALDGMTLRRTREDLQKVVATRGGVWKDGLGDGIAEVNFPNNGNRYRIAFSASSNLSREISLIGPVPSDRHDFIFSIQRRFGAYNLHPWKGADDVQVEHIDGYVNGKPVVPQEMRLSDLREPVQK